MKKLLITLLLGAGLCSCSTYVSQTATSLGIATGIKSYNEADLIVSSSKISYTMIVPKKDAKLGYKKVHEKAVALALKENGDADVLVAPQYATSIKRHRIRKIVVTGYPATYKNFTKATPCPTCK
jgi:hypothetical protein